MSLRRRTAWSTTDITEEGASDSPPGPALTSCSSSSTPSPAQDHCGNLTVALQRFSDYLVRKLENREQAEADDEDSELKSPSAKSKLRKKKERIKKKGLRKKTPQVWPAPREVIRLKPSSSHGSPGLGSSTTVSPLLNRGTGLSEAPKRDAIDLGSDSEEEEPQKRKARRQAPPKKPSIGGVRTSSRSDGAQKMARKPPPLKKQATQHNLKSVRRGSMMRSTMQAARRRPLMSSKMGAGRCDGGGMSRSRTAPKVGPKVGGGPRMAGVSEFQPAVVIHFQSQFIICFNCTIMTSLLFV